MFGVRVFHICDESPRFYNPIKIWKDEDSRSKPMSIKFIDININ